MSSLAMGTIFRGWALTEQGQEEEGIAQIRPDLVAIRARGMNSTVPQLLALLAEACRKAGRIEEGSTALAEALDIITKTGERWYEAELYRLKGDLLLSAERGTRDAGSSPQSLILSPQAEAEECFHQALDIARRQSAKSLELRAVMSLSRLWQRQGKKEEARQMLAEIYGWFTEGFDTKDLQEAKVLLAELN